MSEQEFNILFAKNLNHYLHINGKTQLDLANHLGVSTSAVSAWCRGTKIPRMDKVDTMCKYFGIRRSDLMEDKDTKSNSYYFNDDARLGNEQQLAAYMHEIYHIKNGDYDKHCSADLIELYAHEEEGGL